MNFPIHGYPNDYWRFTPEAFRALAADFSRVMIFPAGRKNFLTPSVEWRRMAITRRMCCGLWPNAR